MNSEFKLKQTGLGRKGRSRQLLVKTQAKTKKKGKIVTGLPPSMRLKKSHSSNVQTRDVNGDCCCNPVLITEAEINQPGGYVIGSPGLYKLAEDATYTPSGGIFGGGFFTGAINIVSNDVTLDLCDHTLKQVDDSVSDVYGVQIGDGYNIFFTEEELAKFSGQGASAAEPYLGATVPVTIKGGEQVKVEFEKDSVWYGGVDACYFYLKNLTATNPATGPVAFPLAGASVGTLPDNGSFEVDGLRFKVVSNSPAVPWSVEDLTASPPPEKLASDPAGTRVLRCGMEETYQGDAPGGSVTALDDNVTGIIISAVDSNPAREYTFDLEVRYSTETNYDFVRVFKNLLECRSFENITIQNGTIRDFSSCGIFAYNATFDFGCDPKHLYKNLHFQNLSILKIGGSDSLGYVGTAICLDTTFDFLRPDTLAKEADVAYDTVTIQRCIVNDTDTTSPAGSDAVWVGIFNNLTISDSQCNNTHQDSTGYTAGFSGVGLNLQMWNCQANRTISQGNDQVGAVTFYQSQNMHIWDCHFNDVFGENSALVNSNFSVNRNLLVERCQFNNYRGGSNARSVLNVHGSDYANTTEQGSGYKFVDCQFNTTRIAADNTLTGDSVLGGVGIISVSNVEFIKCQTQDIDAGNNPIFRTYGYFGGTSPDDPLTEDAIAANNWSWVDCRIQDIHSNAESVGIYYLFTGVNRTGRQGDQFNVSVTDCNISRVSSTSSTEKVAGIAEGLFPLYAGLTPVPYRANNLTVRNSVIVDVKAGPENPLSAGILTISVKRPIIQNNILNDCDRGILLTGTDEIEPANAFQVAATLEDATASTPIPIEIEPLSPYIVTTDKPGVGPYQALLAGYSPTFVPTTGTGLAADPINACSALTNDLTSKIGVCRRGGCSFVDKTSNVEAAGGVGTIVVQSSGAPFIMSGAPTGAFPSVMISKSDGDALLLALANDPSIVLTIDEAPQQCFENTAKGNVATFTEITQRVTNTFSPYFVISNEDLNVLGWQAGDPIVYDPKDGVIVEGLVPGQTYYAIVYRPGFSTRGLIQSNSATNNSISGFQDDQTPCTSSAWLSNTGFCNGPEGKKNYEIKWGCRPPVARGNLSCYPKRRFDTDNVSITCGKCDCNKEKHKCHKKKHYHKY